MYLYSFLIITALEPIPGFDRGKNKVFYVYLYDFYIIVLKKYLLVS